MNDRNNPNTAGYSTQPAGSRARILVTRPGDGTTPATTSTLVTLEADVAGRVAAELERLQGRRGSLLLEMARHRPGQVCHLRRALVAAVLGERDDKTTAAARDLAEIAASLAGPQRRAIADEVARIFDGTDDVLVPVDLTDEFGGLLFATLANGWLPEATDDDVLGLLDPTDELCTTVLYEGLFAYLRAIDTDIDAAADSEWVDIDIDAVALQAWARRNRPHLADQLDELADNAHQPS